MKRKNPLAIVGAWLAFSLAPSHSVQGADGASPTATITGRVQNVVTGRYLENARISVKGTSIAVMTDDAGRYVLANVPSGATVLEVFFTGLDAQQIPLTLSPGQSALQDIRLTNVARYGDKEVVSLDPFLVPSSRMTEGEELAINEQRHAPNIKNVVSTDAMGEVMGGNIGEFLKYLPGVATTGGVFEPDEIYVRGFPSRLTAVTSERGDRWLS